MVWQVNLRPFPQQARPMTRYLPNLKEEFDLRAHVESSGHNIDTCPFVILTEKMCKGHLIKMGGKIKSWKKRWFVFDRIKRNFCYYVGEETQKALQQIQMGLFEHLLTTMHSSRKTSLAASLLHICSITFFFFFN